MIVDNFKNIDINNSFSEDIYSALKFLQSATPHIEIGDYQTNKHE